MVRFALGEVPVGVHFSFLLIAFIGPGRGASEIAAWTIAVFVAVLVHEAGHAFTARAYGARQVAITLFALGGVTTYPVDTKLSNGRRFVIAAAGSAVGIVLGGVVGLAWLGGGFDDASSLTRLFALSFIWAALGWGVLNWIPIRPLDGGQMLTSALLIVAPVRGVAIARVVSAITGLAVVWVALAMNQQFLALFVVFITVVGLRPGPDEDSSRAPSDGAEDDPPLDDGTGGDSDASPAAELFDPRGEDERPFPI